MIIDLQIDGKDYKLDTDLTIKKYRQLLDYAKLQPYRDAKKKIEALGNVPDRMIDKVYEEAKQASDKISKDADMQSEVFNAIEVLAYRIWLMMDGKLSIDSIIDNVSKIVDQLNSNEDLQAQSKFIEEQEGN